MVMPTRPPDKGSRRLAGLELSRELEGGAVGTDARVAGMEIDFKAESELPRSRKVRKRKEGPCRVPLLMAFKLGRGSLSCRCSPPGQGPWESLACSASPHGH